MNLTCPKCGAPAISMLRKIFASELFPASCQYCGVLVASKRGFVWAAVVTFIDPVVVLGSLLLAWMLRSFWPLAAGFALEFFVLPFLFEWWTSLIVVEPETRHRYRRNAVIGVIVFVLLVVIAGLTDRA